MKLLKLHFYQWRSSASKKKKKWKKVKKKWKKKWKKSSLIILFWKSCFPLFRNFESSHRDLLPVKRWLSGKIVSVQRSEERSVFLGKITSVDEQSGPPGKTVSVQILLPSGNCLFIQSAKTAPTGNGNV